MNKLLVKFNEVVVGTLVLTKNKKIVFEYADEWIRNGFSLNPFSLPLEKKVFIPEKTCFNGLFGVFADSLPDSWGRLLVDRYLKKRNISDVNELERLAIVGKGGMGGLTYEPEIECDVKINAISLDELNLECGKILKNEPSNELDQLFKLAGSSGGARPKVLMRLESKNWLIKFSNHIDQSDSGIMEYDYFLCAEKCGIKIPEVKLFPSKYNSGYFGIERFDILNGRRFHMVTVAGLLEADYRSPCLDYYDLLKLTKILTDGRDTYEMFRRMCFNVFAHNRDDHAKNTTFIYDDFKKKWCLSPAYDLTYSTTYYGEHTTSINYKGKNITDEDLLAVGLKVMLNKKKCLEIIESVKNTVNEMLVQYLK